MKRFLSAVLLFAATVSLVGCKKHDKMVTENTQELSAAFANGDMGTINQTIFGSSEQYTDEAFPIARDERTETKEGVLEHIFRHVTITEKNTTAHAIEYEIKAPDMKNVFADLTTDTADPSDDTLMDLLTRDTASTAERATATDISEEALLQHIKDYAANAELTTAVVSLDYVVVDGQLIVDYRDEAFINAVTGGLLDAYKDLYQQMLDEYAKGVE